MTRINRGFQRTTLGSVLWLLCFQYFVAEQIARLASRAPYSVARNVISDLGAVRCVVSTADAVCSPLHWLMNSSFVLQGLLIFFGGLLVRNVFPRGKLFTVALILITLSGIGLSIVGLAPEDVHRAIHYAAAAEHFLLNNIGVALLGAALLLQSRWPRLFASFTLGCGSIGLVATLLLSKKIFLGIGIGGMERVAAYPFPLWLTLTGLFLLLQRRPLTGDSSPR
jgi:hypothetical membrane protein